MKTPSFWYDHTQNWQSLVLKPLAALYGIGRAIDAKKTYFYKSKIPVICVGNLTAGGSGKTPASIALMQYIKKTKRFRNPAFLIRGFSDEHALLEAHAPVIANKNRVEGAKQAEHKGYDCIIMDDGFQNASLYKDLSFVVVQGKKLFGNGNLIPAGPLREPLHIGLKRADAVILIDGADTPLSYPIPVIDAKTEFEMPDIDIQTPVIGFAGIAHPDLFQQSLKELGYKISGFHAFPDHYHYTDKDIEILKANAESLGASLITTEKDYARLQKIQKNKIYTLNMYIYFNNLKKLSQILDSNL